LSDHACLGYSLTGDGADWRFDAPAASILAAALAA
jgi:hypothetical protein